MTRLPKVHSTTIAAGLISALALTGCMSPVVLATLPPDRLHNAWRRVRSPSSISNSVWPRTRTWVGFARPRPRCNRLRSSRLWGRWRQTGWKLCTPAAVGRLLVSTRLRMRGYESARRPRPEALMEQFAGREVAPALRVTLVKGSVVEGSRRLGAERTPQRINGRGSWIVLRARSP